MASLLSLPLPAAPPAPFSSLGATGSALKSSSMEAASELALEERAKGAWNWKCLNFPPKHEIREGKCTYRRAGDPEADRRQQRVGRLAQLLHRDGDQALKLIDP